MNMKPKECQNIDTVTEQIVIDYANLSGRESANRSEFRTLVRGHIINLLEAVAVACKEDKRTVNTWDSLFVGKDPIGEQQKALYTNGYNAGLDTAAKLIRSLK